MPIDVSDAICPHTAQVLTVERKTGGGYVDGIYQDGTVSTFKTMASVQQPTPEDLQILTAGERNKDLVKFVSKKRVYGVSDRDGTQADVIILQGVRYKVINSSKKNIYGYTTVIGGRIE